LKNARAKTPHTAGENLVKSTVVKLARTMCSDAHSSGDYKQVALPGQMHITRFVHGPQLHMSSYVG